MAVENGSSPFSGGLGRPDRHLFLEDEAMLTVKKLRDLLEGLEDDSTVLVAVVGVKDGHKLLAAAEAPQEGEGVNISVPSPLQGVEAYQADHWSVVIFAVSQDD
jgi:hypothetical protein